jgi:hypothetical protein
MLLAAICEACRRPLTDIVVNVQLQEGELISAGNEFKVRQTRNPHLFSFCRECSGYLDLTIRALMANGGAPRAAVADAPAEPQARAS